MIRGVRGGGLEAIRDWRPCFCDVSLRIVVGFAKKQAKNTAINWKMEKKASKTSAMLDVGKCA